MSDALPRQLGDFEVLAKIADGGVGTIYLARRVGPKEFRRLVALKRLHPEYAGDASFVTMFTDEARLAARIHHANVVPVVELGADDDGYYVVMEYIEGANLSDLHFHATRAHGGLPRPVAMRITLDALAGLHAAHETKSDDGTTLHLVHRDVSPQNILVGADGLARLSDFGIARASAHRAFETRGAALKGKLEYMAPEQIECRAVDRTTDLFAMGIVLWELLTGRRLFPAANQLTTIQRVCFDPIPSPRTIDPRVSAELEQVAARALERVPALRYPTADAFAEELERAARADEGIATPREVAACLGAVLGEAMPGAQRRLEALSRAPAPAEVPDLAARGRHGAATHQLPASNPFITIDAGAAGVRGAALAHPPIGGEAIDTEPNGPAPVMTAHYDEGVPSEVLAEAGLRSRTKK